MSQKETKAKSRKSSIFYIVLKQAKHNWFLSGSKLKENLNDFDLIYKSICCTKKGGIFK